MGQKVETIIQILNNGTVGLFWNFTKLFLWTWLSICAIIYFIRSCAYSKLKMYVVALHWTAHTYWKYTHYKACKEGLANSSNWIKMEKMRWTLGILLIWKEASANLLWRQIGIHWIPRLPWCVSNCRRHLLLVLLNIGLNQIKLFVTDHVNCSNYLGLRVDSHLQFIRRESLCKIFSPHNRENWVPNPLLSFSVHSWPNRKIAVQPII